MALVKIADTCTSCGVCASLTLGSYGCVNLVRISILRRDLFHLPAILLAQLYDLHAYRTANFLHRL
ncbi:hypothetical protein ACN4EK_13710 [Pantanalinema rosaneae CENA516]|uniref:hypothetical protein n=1 Tax=Pantanalinema rosaneae TaxID=1620701 RepID=UPI003D6F2298